MKKLFISLLLLGGSLISFGQGISKTIKRLPDTGQTSNFTATPGEDSDYSINPPFFQVNGDGTATDTVTGLMWQQTDGGEMTFENALLYCDTLTLGGYTDWRLPSPQEAFSMLNQGHANPALDGAVFTTSAAEYWWTGWRQVNDSTRVWVTNAGGGIGNHPKNETISAGGSKKFHVRAVRTNHNPEFVPFHYTDNGNGTITDHLTQLMWQKISIPDTIVWEQALQYADTLSLAGYQDWRLPNIKELHSINDEKKINPSVDTTFFNNIGVKIYWSSTSLPNQTTQAWFLDTRFGLTSHEVKSNQNNVICVRGNTDDISGIIGVAPTLIYSKAYPNPFQNSTDIEFATTTEDNGVLRIYNANGSIVFEQKIGHLVLGKQTISWDARKQPAGIYYYEISLFEKGVTRSRCKGSLIVNM